MTSLRVVRALENWSRNFAKGIGDVFGAIHFLIPDDEISGTDGAPKNPQEKVPEQKSELARRREEKQKAKGETVRNPKVEEGSVRRMLWTVVWKNAVLCSISVLLITHFVMPLLLYLFGDSLDKDAQRTIWKVFAYSWLAPIWSVAKIINIFWMNDLANIAYRQSRGRPAPSNVTSFFADITFTSMIEISFIVQIVVLSMIPVLVGGFNVIELFLTAISYSLYAFEYKWMNMGFDVTKRLNLIDRNLAYHLGFGLPMAFLVLCFDSFWIRFIVYSVLFPILILSASKAEEPTGLRGRTCYIFHLPVHTSRYAFRLTQQVVKRFGFWYTVRLGLLLAVLYLLGVAQVLLNLPRFLLTLLTHQSLSDLGAWVHHIYQLGVEWLRS